MRHLSFLLVLTFAPAVTSICILRADERPNIVVIMADDLGFSDLGCYGSEIPTPRLDEIAAAGIRMTQFYNTAKCHSSRVALLSGMYCDQAGAESLSRCTTFARELRGAGYFTAMAGKWHLHDQPTDHGFDRYFGHLSGATNFFTGDDTFRLNGEVFDDFGEDFYTTIANTDYAIKFVDEALETDKPFLLYVAHNAPHYPLHAREEDYRRHEGRYDVGWDVIREQRYNKQVESGLIDREQCTLSPRPEIVSAWQELSDSEKLWESKRMSAYAAMVDRLDREIGRLVDHLQKQQVFDNTLFVFVSDNGACPFDRTKRSDKPPYDPESYWCYDPGWAHVGNTPFRFYKQNNHEGGIASPAILHWPAGMTAKAGSIDRQPAHLIDIMATCLEIAGAEYPDTVSGRQLEPLMGRSLVPILKGQQRIAPDYLYFQFGDNRALRKGDWKLVSYRRGPWELYNLATDRTELANLVEKSPERFASMRAEWFRIAKDIDRLPAARLKPVSPEPLGGSTAVHPGEGEGK